MSDELIKVIYKEKPFLDNKYTNLYLKLLSKSDNNEYTEKHHILPKSIFPDYQKCDWNIIRISARKHFIVHMLLQKMFKKGSKEYGKMITAVIKMKRVSPGQKSYINSKLYEISSKRWADYKRGKPITERHKQILSKLFKGKKKGPMDRRIVEKILETKRNTVYETKKVMHKEKVQKRINISEVDDYLKDGWKLGFIKKSKQKELIYRKKLSEASKIQWKKVKETGHTGNLIRI